MSHDARVSRLNEQAVELLKRGRVPASVEENMKNLNERWTSTIKRLSKSLITSIELYNYILYIIIMLIKLRWKLIFSNWSVTIEVFLDPFCSAGN
jgi:hypothetical protein